MVRRSRETIALGLLLTLVSAGVAQDLPAPIPAGVPAAARKVPETTVSAKRRRLEQKLQTPAAVPLEGRKTITLDEFIQHVRDQHHIAIRLDLANLRTVPFGEMSGSTSCGTSSCGVYSVRQMSCSPAGCVTVPAVVPAYGAPLAPIRPSLTTPAADLPPGAYSPAAVPVQPTPVRSLPPAASYSVADDIGAGVSLQVVQATSLTAGALIVSGGAGTATEKSAAASDNPIRGDAEKPLVDQLRSNPKTSVVTSVTPQSSFGVHLWMVLLSNGGHQTQGGKPCTSGTSSSWTRKSVGNFRNW